MNIKEIYQNIEIAIQASIQAGIEIMNVYNSPNFEISIKQDNSPVTKADIAASNIICKMLQQTNYPIICEEISIEPFEIRKTWNVLWIVDPLDGTKDFIERNNEFTVNIALIEKNTPIAGVIYIPAIDTLYFSICESGSYVLHNAIEHTTHFSYIELVALAMKLPLEIQNQTDYTIVASRSFLDEKTKSYIESIQTSKTNTIVKKIGSSLKFTEVASGMAQMYPRLSHIHEWDIAAGHAIALGANCTFVDFYTKKTITYNSESLLSPCFILEQ